MFVPVSIRLGAGDSSSALYDRSIELTSRQLVAFEREAGNMAEPLTQIGADLRTSVGAQFATQGAQGATGKWTVLSESYGAWKRQHAPGVPILVGIRPATKRTRSSKRKPAQTYQPSGEMRKQLLEPLATHVTPRRLLYAPTSDIAGFHETGTEHMPARPPVDLSLAFLHSVDRAFVGWLAGLMKRLGL